MRMSLQATEHCTLCWRSNSDDYCSGGRRRADWLTVQAASARRHRVSVSSARWTTTWVHSCSSTRWRRRRLDTPRSS